METGNRPIHLKQAYSLRKIQNGNGRIDSGLPAARGMDDVPRLDGRVLSYSDRSRPAEVFPLHGRRDSLSVHSDALRLVNSATLIHRTGEGVQKNSSPKRVLHKPVSGRLVESEPFVSRGLDLHYKTDSSSSQTRFYPEFTEVESNSIPSLRLPGIHFRFGEEPDLPLSGEGTQYYSPLNADSPIQMANCKGLHETDRPGHISHEGDSRSQGSTEVDPVASKKKLELLRLFASESSSDSESLSDSGVVPGSAQFVKRLLASSPYAGSASVHRRVNGGMGGSLPRAGSPRNVVSSGDSSPHQCARVQGSIKLSRKLSSSSEGEGSHDRIRQLDGGLLHPQGRRSKDMGIEPIILETLHMGEKAPSHYSGETHTRVSECAGRQIVSKGPNSPNRMVPQPTCVPEFDKEAVATNGRPIRNSRKSKASNIRQPDSRSSGHGSRRHEHGLDGAGRVRLPTYETSGGSSEQDKATTLQGASDSTSVANSSLVLGLDPTISGSARTASSDPNASQTDGGSHLRSVPGDEESPCMDDLAESLSNRGFSEQVVARVSAPQRESTRRVYQSQFKQFQTWAKSNGVDACHPTVAQISDFLLYLFNVRGFQPGTIQGYRTAITEMLPDVSSIKDAPELQRLIRSFFRDKPRASRSLVPWDLRVVLDALSRPPFEPINSVEIKMLAFKTVFLTALATGRRRGEIRAFSFQRTLWRELDDSIQLVPHPDFLPKNLKATDPNASVKPIVIPSLAKFVGPDLAEDALNCPVRAIRTYMKRTLPDRKDRTLLFIPLIATNAKEISPNTISGWMKHTIEICYREQEKVDKSLVPISGTIKAHQVRGVAATWAARGNVSLPQIMGSCFWRSQNTFTSYYLKDTWKDVEDNYTIGSFVAAQSVISPGGTTSLVPK